MRPIDRLLELMARLRAPDGCPWDREQTRQTLRPFLLEEAYEVVEAIDLDRPELLCDELGDLLLQVVFHAQLGKERGEFDFDRIAAGIHAKLVRRHPHVFGDQPAGDADEAWRRWESIKVSERSLPPDGTSVSSRLDGIPHALPALMRAQKVIDKAARAGFDWVGPAAVMEKVEEELRELRAALEAGGTNEACEELGDLLFALVSLARKLEFDVEAVLAQANRKFEKRFRTVEQLAAGGAPLDQRDPEDLDRLWRQAK